MISKNLLKSYGLFHVEDYFQMCIESKINGNYTQCKEQLKKANKEQLKQFINSEIYGNDEHVQYCKNIALQLI